jgi:CRISPR-associated protein Cmr3
VTAWIIEPRDPIVARDGRPFTAAPGARAVSLPFPMPSTISGAARTRAGGEPFDKGRIATLLAKSVRGPLLVELGPDGAGAIRTCFFPAPADALMVARTDGKVALEPAAPIELRDGEATDLPSELLAVGPSRRLQGKPPRGAPRWWSLTKMVEWLEKPAACELDAAALRDLGVEGPEREARMHVAVEPGPRTAKDQALFSTEGLRFEVGERIDGPSRSFRRFAILVETDLDIEAGIDTLGGEGRTVVWRRAQDAKLPECPESIRRTVAREGACRLVLVTPGVFDAGYLSRLTPSLGVTPKIVAAAVPRNLTVSGYDFQVGKPKPTRRLAPAGSVYFVRLDGGPEARERWVKAAWLESVADREQDRRDGFGLALVGTWDGMAREMAAEAEGVGR